MLESSRDYALHRLAASDGELHAARHHHARAVADVMWRAAEALWSTSDAEWLPRWASELDNVRAALDWSAKHDIALFVSLIGSAPGLFRLLDLGYELRRRAAAVDVEAADGIDAASAVRYWYARAVVQAGLAAAPAYEFALKAERLARAIDDRRRLYAVLCLQAGGGLVAGDEAEALLSEIIALESPQWSPRIRANRHSAEFAIHTVAKRYPEALQAAEAGLALAIEAGTILLTALCGTWVVVALLDMGEVDAAAERIREIAPRILSGPAGMVIPFVGTCARCSYVAGDIAGAKRELQRMFALCRSVEWANFDLFAQLYVKVALAEGRLDAAARLLGFAAEASKRTWRMILSVRGADDVRAVLGRKMDPERLARLGAAGERLDNESVCALVLE
jgi:hypothetical protein